MATFETRHFLFQTFAQSEEEALSQLQSAWSRHVFTNEAAQQMGHPTPDPDNCTFLEFNLGDTFRDGELY